MVLTKQEKKNVEATHWQGKFKRKISQSIMRVVKGNLICTLTEESGLLSMFVCFQWEVHFSKYVSRNKTVEELALGNVNLIIRIISL